MTKIQEKTAVINVRDNIRGYVVLSKGDYKNGYYRNFIGMFLTLGEKVTEEGYIKVSGCGMNMVFSLKNQTLLSFENMGFLQKGEALKLVNSRR